MTHTQTAAMLIVSFLGIIFGTVGFLLEVFAVDGSSDAVLAALALLCIAGLGGMGWALSEPVADRNRRPTPPTRDPVTPDTGLYRRRTTADMQTFLSEHGETLRGALEEAEYESESWLAEIDDADWRDSRGRTREQHLEDYRKATVALEALLYARPSTDGPTTLWYFGPDHDSREVYFGEYASRDDAELEATRQRHNPRYASGTFVTEL
jgi:hypothetical protein